MIRAEKVRILFKALYIGGDRSFFTLAHEKVKILFYFFAIRCD
jgi:hypothetical protein